MVNLGKTNNLIIMQNLVETLKEKTKDFKEEYIQRIRIWAVKDFEELKQWAVDYQNGKYGYGKASKIYYRLPYYIVNSNGNVDNHIDKKVKDANAHYDVSIKKLASRIEKKGLNKDLIMVHVNRIGSNIEATITDGERTVKAWTIIASGPIQKPHYRYLVK